MLFGLFPSQYVNIHWNVSFLVSFVIQNWIQSCVESHFFLFGGLSCTILTKCRFEKNETWFCNLVWGKHNCRESLLCTALCAVFNGPNLELFYNGIMYVRFLHTKTICRQIKQLLIITYSDNKILGQGLFIFSFASCKNTRTSDFGWPFLHSGVWEDLRLWLFFTQYFDTAWVTSVRYWLSLDVNILTAFQAMPHGQQRADWPYGIGSTSWWLVWMTWTLQMTCMTKWWRLSIMPLLSVAQEPANQKRTSSGDGSICIYRTGILLLFFDGSHLSLTRAAVAGFCEHMITLIICSSWFHPDFFVLAAQCFYCIGFDSVYVFFFGFGYIQWNPFRSLKSVFLFGGFCVLGLHFLS